MSPESSETAIEPSQPSASMWYKDLLTVFQWIGLIVPLAVAVGAVCAFFLWSLESVTRLRFDNPWLLYLLPLAGFAIGWIYLKYGGKSDGGNNLIIDQIHEPGGGVPRRMAWLVLLGTLVTHLFGGSAGREGTAVQMGGSMASGLGRVFRLNARQMRILLMAGVAAGFGAVFGTPLAGALFAVEVVVLGRLQYDALIPCFVASLTGDWACQALGAGHTHFYIGYLAGQVVPSVSDLNPLLVGKVLLAAAAFGLASALFSELSHRISGGLKRLVPYAPLRPLFGGLAVIALVYIVGSRDYLGLGVWSSDPNAVSLTSLFAQPDVVRPWSWWWKIIFTAVTVASGFKGGEVTSLFFIGAALGNVLAWMLGAPADLFAALGFVAVFAGASNTPLACTVMGIELFGATHGLLIATACMVSYLFSGHSGVYLSQRVAAAKPGWRRVKEGITLRSLRKD